MVFDASAWLPSSYHDRQKEPKGVTISRTSWTVSYGDSLRRTLAKVKTSIAPQEEEEVRYAAADRCSPEFQRLSAENHAEHVRLRRQLRGVATHQRSLPQPAWDATVPDLTRFLDRVDAATQVCDHVSVATASGAGLEADAEHPRVLGHLISPPRLPALPETVPRLPESEPAVASQVYRLISDAGVSEHDLLASMSQDSWPQADAAAALSLPGGTGSVDAGDGVAEASLELTRQQSGAARSQRSESNQVRAIATDGNSSPDGSEGGLSFDDDDMDEDEMPRPPILRFKAMVQFSVRFEGGNVLQQEQERQNKIKEKQRLGKRFSISSDPDIYWFNQRFLTTITSDSEVMSGWPVMALIILDAVYPSKVPWQRVDWRWRYDSSTSRNYELLLRIWDEVGMDKTRIFRVTETSLRIEDMMGEPFPAKLAFLRLMKKWFFTRVHAMPKYDPLRRQEEELSKEVAEYRAMPEFKRLIWFKGSTDIMEM
eukprot:TRINITY_DN5791_c0_g1_i1.p1 TRINITY_DN5791_c0_g1~~TRINITY_DN5791_c0_g1_i1.p1  ORF type:complete len:484 (-),score=93.47 TRINITY_DN5791_c0_g1_i1:259-1710(-)